MIDVQRRFGFLLSADARPLRLATEPGSSTGSVAPSQELSR